MFEAAVRTLEQPGVLAVAFAAWAFVVFWIGMKLVTRMDKLAKEVAWMNHYSSNRITAIETHLSQDGKFQPYRNGKP